MLKEYLVSSELFFPGPTPNCANNIPDDAGKVIWLLKMS